MKATTIYRTGDTVVKTSTASSTTLREKAILEKLHHPRIVSVLPESGGKGLAGLFMPYYHQGSLKDLLNKNPQGLPPHRAALLTIEVLESLSYINSCDFILAHRDIKPANVFITMRGHAQLGDFGSALLVSDLKQDSNKENELVGTLAYCAPEQINDPYKADIQSDLYSCGLMFWELLSGSHCFKGRNALEILSQKFKETPLLEDPSGLPSQLSPAQKHQAAAIINQACSLQPAQRFENPEDFIEAIETSDLLLKREKRARQAIRRAKEKGPFLQWAPLVLGGVLIVLCSLWAAILLCFGA